MRKCDICKELFDTNKDDWLHCKAFKSSKELAIGGWVVPSAFICSKCK